MYIWYQIYRLLQVDAAAAVIAFLFFYLSFIMFLAYSILFGGSPKHESNCIGRVHVFLTETISQSCQSCLARVFCRGADNPEEAANEIFEKVFVFFEHRVMPFIYLSLLSAGLAAAKSQIAPRLADINTKGELCPRSRWMCVPGLPLTLPPTTSPEAVYVYAIIAFVSWLRIFMADPGYINAETFETLKSVYPYDGVIFAEGKDCSTCGHPKLARSKHDKTVDKCILRYDHFCGWTGNVIGLYNTNRFITFLAIHLAMLSHGAMLCIEIVYEKMLQFIDGNYTYTPTNTRITRFIPTVAIAAEPTLCLFFFVLVVSIIVVGAFLVYHVYLVACNTTTSETFKWGPIREECLRFKEENMGRSYGEKLQEAAMKRANGDPNALEDTPLFAPNGVPVNIYDRGLVQNFLEVFFPSRFVRQGPLRTVQYGMAKADRVARARARVTGAGAKEETVTGRPKEE